MKDFASAHFGRYQRPFELFIHTVIIVSLASLCLDTVRGLPDRAYAAFAFIETAALAVFIAEYAARVFLAERATRYIFSFWGLIDFLAIAPALIAGSPAAYVVRAFRLLRLLRILKLARYSRALRRLIAAFDSIRAELAVFCFLSFIVFFIAAAGIYYFEYDAQPDKFSSIPASLWWAIATLTTVGYGDVYPVTTGGKIFTFFILMVGLGLVAVPAGLLASALTNDNNKERA